LSGKSTDQDPGTEVPNGSAAVAEVSDETEADETEAGVPVTSSAKEVFAAALEKKKAAGQARSAHLDGHGGVGGATASHKATRTFRRKSG
jgi:phosphohistidine swiveling domain-containing protein